MNDSDFSVLPQTTYDCEMAVDTSPAHRTSRKHLRSSDDDDNNYDWSSDSTGQFDDAEEGDVEDYRSPAGNSAKRRRSNDWPLPEEAADYGANDRRAQRSDKGHLNVGPAGSTPKVSPRASPRGSLASLRARHAASTSSPRRLRGRASRFVEATMSDSVSEKPPSIYFREHGNEQAAHPNRPSSIFRFGRAIASAFNPFGGWGKSEESPAKSPQKDVISQAEQAYEELKKAGYKGTNKGHYTQTHGIDGATADRTWQSIQENMDHGSSSKDSQRLSIDHSERRGHSRSDSAASKRSSLQDLRLPKSFFHKTHESPSAPSAASYERTSHELECGLHKRPSRKELSRQNKLLKKVSNLEDKLDRARRELREITGNEVQTLEPIPQENILANTQPITQLNTINTEIDPASFPRKFVPGALPTLPSERLLNQLATESEEPGSDVENITALPSMEDREKFSFEETRPVQSPPPVKTPKRRTKEAWPSPLGKESLSRKRKSPIPESLDSRKPSQPCPTDRVEDIEYFAEFKDMIEYGLLSPPGKTKWLKSEAGESPGSAQRKQTAGQHLEAEHDTKQTDGSASTRNRRSLYISPRKPSATNRSSSPKATIPYGNQLRWDNPNRQLISSPPITSEESLGLWSSPTAQQADPHSVFYLQPKSKLDPDRSPRTPTRSKTSPSRSARYRRDDDIPPVPPLPEELRSSAAKVHVNTSPKKRPVSAPVFPSPSASANTMIPGVEDYQWPEDIF